MLGLNGSQALATLIAPRYVYFVGNVLPILLAVSLTECVQNPPATGESKYSWPSLLPFGG